MADIRAGQHEAVGVNRVGRVGNEDRIAGSGRCQRQMGQTFLGANGDNGLGVRVQFNVKPPLVPATNGLAQAVNAFGD